MCLGVGVAHGGQRCYESPLSDLQGMVGLIEVRGDWDSEANFGSCRVFNDSAYELAMGGVGWGGPGGQWSHCLWFVDFCLLQEDAV